MNTRWKKYSAEIKRLWNIIFEYREYEEISADYYSGKWISKKELEFLFEYEKAELIKSCMQHEKNYSDLLEGFNLNSLASYELLERRKQGKLNKQR